MVPEAEGVFGRRRTSECHFSERGTNNSYVLRSIAVSPQPGRIEKIAKVRRHESMKAAGVSGSQGTPWSEKLDGKELHGELGGECDLEPRGSALFCTSSTRN